MRKPTRRELPTTRSHAPDALKILRRALAVGEELGLDVRLQVGARRHFNNSAHGHGVALFGGKGKGQGGGGGTSNTASSNILKSTFLEDPVAVCHPAVTAARA